MPLDPLPTPDAPQVTFPDGCAADPIKTFEGYPGIQVDAPQVERFNKSLAVFILSGECCFPAGNYVKADDYASLLAERDRARSAYRDQHAKTLFEHERAERAEAENKELRAWQSGLQSDFVAVVKQAEAVESSLASLRDAVREEARMLDKHGYDDIAAKLRALVDPQGAKSDE